MSEQMQIKAQEHGLIRVFAVDLATEEIATFSEQSDAGWALKEALGATQLNSAYVELFDVADLDDLGLTGYMRQGLGVMASDIAEMRSQIDTLTGPVLIILSKAFDGQPQSLSPKAPLRWIGTFREEAANVQFKPIQSEAAKGTLAPPASARTTNPHLTLIAAILALPVIIGLLGLLIWLILR